MGSATDESTTSITKNMRIGLEKLPKFSQTVHFDFLEACLGVLKPPAAKSRGVLPPSNRLVARYEEHQTLMIWKDR